MNYDQKEDFMTDECKYKFMKSFIAVIDQIQTKELSNELINSIKEFKTKLNEFKKRNDFFLCKRYYKIIRLVQKF